MKTHSFAKLLLSMFMLFAALFAVPSESSAQTTLAAGDISFTAFNANTPDNFAFVTWVPIQTGTYIKFTDGGYNAAASATQAANARGSENFVIWQNNTGSTLAAGTVVKIEGLMASAGVCTAGSASGLNGISASGDQIFAYQGTATSGATPDYSGATATATFSGTLLFGLTFPSAWLTTGTASSNTSYLPTELNVSNGNIAIVTASATSGQYSGSRSNQASLSAYKALVTNLANWTVVTGTAITTVDTTAFVSSGPAPTLTATGTLNAFATTYGTASAAQTVAVSGTNLTAAIVATAPTGFEVSSDGAVYGATATLAQSGGAASGTLSVRLAATAAVSGSYNAKNIALTSTGATAVNVATAASANAVAAKGLTITGVTASNKAYDGGTAAALSGTAAYSGLANGETFTVTGTPSAVFAGVNVATGVAVTVTGYTAPSANYTATQPAGLAANITAAALTVTASGQSKAVGVALSGGAGSVAFTSSGLASGETIGSVTLSYGSGALAGDVAGTYAGSITPSAATGGTFTASNYNISYVAGTLTVTTDPTLSANGILSALDTIYGTPTATPGSMTVSGGNLSASITVTAPSGFEVSVSAGSGYAASVTLPQSGGVVANTTVYVRLAAATNAGAYSGNVVVASAGATSRNVAAAPSTVTPKGLTITGLSGVNREYDGTTAATLSGTAAYTGLANAESFAVSGTPTASFATKTAGTTKAVTVTGYTAPSANYTVTQPTGVTANITAKALTVTGAAVTSKPYDGTTAAVITGTLSGALNGDVVTLIGTGTFASPTVGTGIAVTSTSTLGGADAGNYTLTQPTGLSGSIVLDGDATLSSLVLSAGALNPTFAAGTLSYAVRVNDAVASVTVTATCASAVSTVKVNGTTVASGAASSAINLNAGSNTVTVAVTAQNGTVKTYTLTVSRSSAFTAGNLVVLRSDAATAATASSVSLVEYTTAAGQSGPVQTIAVDSSATGLTLTGNSTTQGVLTRSSDGTVLSFGGYRKAAGGSNPQSDATATTNRVVGIVGASGTTVDLSTAVTDGFSADSLRAVATVDGTSFYLSGAGASSTGGVRYVTSAGSATTSTPVNNGATGTPNTRQMVIAGGSLLVASGASNPGNGVHKVGSGLPTSGTPVYTPSISTAGQIHAFYFTNLGSANDWASTGFDTLYTADGTSLTKWSYTGAAWVSNGAVAFTASSLGCIVGSTTGSVVTLYGTTNVASTGTIFSLSDSAGFNQAFAGTPVTLATVDNGAAFRGIAFAPADSAKIAANGSLAAVDTTYGTPSAAPTQFTVSGSLLTGNLTVTAPAGFEVSTAASSGYGATVTLSPTSGTLASTVVNVRLAAATAVGTYSGNITVSGGGATQKTLATAASIVSAAPLTITGVSVASRAYNATTTATLSGTAAYAGLKNGDTFAVTGTPVAAFDTAAAGATKPVTVTGYTAPSANYVVTQPAGLSAAITPAALTITATDVSKGLGGTLASGAGSTAFTASGLVGGETVGSVTITYGIGAATGAVAGTYAGSVVPSAVTGGSFDPANYSLSYVAGTLTVTSGPVLNASGVLAAVNTTYGTASLSPSSFSVSGSNLTGDITVTAPAGFEVSTNSSSGYAGAATITRSGSAVTSTPVYVRIAATTGVGTYTGNCTVATAGVASQSVAVTSSVVLPKSLTLSGLSGVSRIYNGGTTATLSGTPAYVGLVNGDSPAVAGAGSASFADKAVGTAKPLTVTGFTNPSANYTVTQPAGLTADITAKGLTVIGAAVTSKPSDTTTAAVITGTLSGVVNGDTVTLVGTGTFASPGVGTGIAVTSTSTLGGADAGNYTLTQPTGLTGSITKGSQTITFAALAAKAADSAPFALTATASSGLAVSYASSNTAVATVSGGTVTIVGAGTTTITASQAGDANFNGATPVDQTLTVNAAGTLTAGDIAIIGYNTAGAPDSFTILVLKDLPGGTVFYVNDNEIAADGGAAFTDLNEGEASFTVKAGQTIAAGTVVTLPWGGAAVSTTTYDWSATTGSGFGSNNDEIYIYTAALITSTTPTAFLDGAGIGTSPSARAAGLVLGSTWIKPSGVASRYKTTGAVYSGTKAALLAAIGDTAANWEAVAPVADLDWTFTVSGGSTAITGTVAIADVSVAEGNSGTSTMSFTVTRSNAATAFTVSYATADGTGASPATTADADYVATSGTLTFAAGGALTQTIAVTINGDAVLESNETLLVKLSNVVNSVGTTTLATTQAVGTITDDDGAAARITSQPASQGVVSGRTATLTVVASGTPTPTYQWYLGASGTTSSPVAGATSASYTTPVLVSNASYWVRATNATGSADSTTAVLTVALGTPFSNTSIDVVEPNTVTWNPAGVTLNGTQFVNLGLQGMGRVAASTKDPVTGESLGSVSAMQVSGWRRNADGSYSGTFQFLPDRGYNNGTTYSNYAARLNAFDFTFTPYTSTSPTSAQNQIALTFAGATRFTYDHDGNAATPGVFTTGLLADGTATLFGTTVPVATGAQVQSDGSVTGRLTLDSEGLVLDQRPGKAGSGWIGDEYGASIYHFNAACQIDGQLRVPAALVPHKPAGTVNFNGTPDNGRRDNQGFEGIAQSPDGRKLFALMQSALIQDSLSGSQGRYNTRLLVYDITGSDTPSDPVAQYVIQLPRVDTTGSTTNGTTVDKTAAQSAIVALNDHQILILSRDGNGRGSTGTPVFKSVLIADTASATNIDESYDAEGATVISGGALAGSITPMAWSEAVNLIGKLGSASAEVEKFGLNLNTAPGDINTLCEKWEALALMPANDAANPHDYFLFVGNDNDFMSRSGKYLDAAGVLQSYDATLESDTIVLAYRVRITGPDNQAPFVVKAIADQPASAPTPFSFTFAADTFVDPEGGVLTYTASKADDTALPSWLSFNGSTRTFSGTPTQFDVGSLSLKVIATDAGASPLSVSTTFAINVAGPAAITSQPASQSVVSGRTATLTVVASGTPAPTYQWYLGTTGITFSPVAGATSASYTTPVLVSNARYWVRVTNATGSADSATAVLTVALGTPVSSTSIDVIEPNTVTWNPAGVTLNGTQFVNLGLQGMGRVAASTKDPVTGESLGSVSDMQVSGWRRNADGSYSGTFQFLPDRGYNNGTTYSNYAARLNAFDFTFTPYTSSSPTSAQNQIALTFTGATRFTYDHDGNAATPGVFTTGLLADGTATLFGTTVPVATGAQVQSDGSVTGRLTLDSEGLVLDQRPGKAGSGWIGDEYGASIYHFNAARQIDGQLRVPAALVPHKPAGTVNFNGTPDNGRRDNQGVEGIAQSPDGRKLFALMQSATIQDSLSGSQGRYNTRLLVYDITGSDTPADPVAQYVIQLPRVDTTGSTTNGTAVDKTAAQSAIVALNDHQILILSRDGNGRGSTGTPVFKSVLIADTASATNIDGSYDAEGATVISGGALAGSITPMAWSEAVNLIGKLGSSSAEVEKFGLNLNTAPGDINTICEKWEALALMPANDAANPHDYFLFVGNDNDFMSRSGKYLDAAGVLQSYDATLESDTIVLAYRVRITGPDNQTPFLVKAIADQSASAPTPFSFTFAADTFVDPEGGVLTYTASQADDAALPSWLSFNGSTRTFSGTPTQSDVGSLSLKVTATDAGASPLSVSTTFAINVVAPATITSQPASRNVVSGRAATLTAVVSGAPTLTYQWYLGASGNTSSPVVGATSASYTTPVLFVSASYWVRVTNATGSADSTTAVLTVTLGAPVSSTSTDVIEPNTVTWNPAGVTLNGTQFVNLGLQGMGRVAASTKDPVTGESLGSVSDMQITGWRRNTNGSYSGTFQFLPDRGYNNGTTYSNYAARLNKFDFTFTPYTSTSPTSAQNQIALTFAGATRFTYDHDGNAATPGVFTTGLLADGTATLFGTTVPVATGAQVQSDGSVTGRLTLDSEGLVLDQRPGKAGSGWIGDEYGASIYHFNAARQIDGQLRVPAALVPHKPAGTVNFNGTPDNGRRDNQGVEGIAQSPDGRKLFALMQSATIQDSLSGSQGRYNTRLLVYDITGSDTPADPVAQYVIQLPRVDTTGSTTNGTTVDKTAAQSAIVALNDHQILILSRDGNGRGSTGTPVFKSVLIADTASATNIDGSYDAEGATVISGGALAGSITPMAWSEAVNLIGSMGSSSAEVEKFGLNLNTAPGDINTLCEKWEALALVSANDPTKPNDYFLFVGNDNDFISRSGKYLDAAGVLQSYDATLESDTIVLAYRVRITGPDNQAPFVVKAIASQKYTCNTEGRFTIPSSVFVDPEGGVLTYTGSKADDTPLPSWLSFSGATRTFSGTPPLESVGTLALKVTATDAGATPLSASASFTLTIAPVGQLSFADATYSASAGDAVTPNTFSAVILRSGESGGAATVQVAADAVGGTLPTDVAYTLATETVSFASGEVSKTVTMTLGNLAYGLLPGTVRIRLQNPVGSAVLAVAGTTALVNVPLTPSFRPGTFAFAQETTTTAARDSLGRPVEASLVINRSNGSRGAASVRVTASGGVLQNGVDYTFNPVVLTFVDGQTSAKIKVPLRYISQLKLPGTITLSLDGATPLGAAVGSTAAANLVVTAPASVADTVKPTITVSAPIGSVVPESFKVAGVVADNVGVDRVEVRLNDGPVQYAVLSGTMGLTRTFSLPVLQPENGANKLDVTVYDLANNATKVTRALSYTNMREELAGTFNGLIQSTAEVSNATSGFVTMKVNNSGVLSGKVLIGGATVPFTGILFNDGSARFMNSVTKTYGASLALANGKTALGSLAITAVDGELGTATGTLSRGSVVAASVSLERAHFDGKMSIVEAPYLANAGAYTVALASKTQVPSMVSSNYPQGDGIGFVTVKPDGSVALQGTLADGTAVLAAGSLSAEYTAVIYVPLYTNGGAFAARLAFDLDQPDSDLEAADALWLRPALPASKMYPAGWPAGVRVDMTGASYVKPVASSTVSVLKNLGAESASGNAALTFSDGALSGSLVKPVNISPANRVTILPSGNTAYALTLVPTSGAFSGTFLHSRGVKTNFSGVILQKGANAGGYGFFLAPTTTTATTIESGGLSLTPAR